MTMIVSTLSFSFCDARLGLHRAAAAFEAERTRHDTDRQRADLLGDLRDDGRAAGAGAAALARGDEHHVGALQHLFDLLAVLLGGLAPDLGIGAGAETAGELATDVELHVGVGEQQRLRVGVDRDELDALQPGVDHAVHRVAATAADADDLDDREVVLRSAEHRADLSFGPARRAEDGARLGTAADQTLDLNLRLTIMSTCALRRDCTGARASKQRSTRVRRWRQPREHAATGARTRRCTRTAASPRWSSTASAAAPLASRSVERAEPDLARRRASTSATPAPPTSIATTCARERRRGNRGTTPRGRRAARAAAPTAGQRAARRALRPRPAGGACDVGDRRGRSAASERDRRASRAHVRGRRVLGDRDAQRARADRACTVACCDPRQLFDAARDRAGVDEQQRRRRCRTPAARATRRRVDVLRAGDPDVVDVEQRRLARRGTRARPRRSRSRRRASTRSRRRPASRCTSMRRSRMRGSIARASAGRSSVVRHDASASVHARVEADEVQLGLEAHAGRVVDARAGPRGSSAYTSAARAPGSATKKLACFSDTTAPPTRRPLQPARVDEPARRRRRAGW